MRSGSTNLKKVIRVGIVAIIVMMAFVEIASSTEENIALNPSGTGYPHPLESDHGWGGGSSQWDIVDGIRTYPGEWARGLAFTGGSNNWGEKLVE